MGLTSITRHLLSQKQLLKIIAYSSGFVSLLVLVVFLSKDTLIDEIIDEVGQEAASQFTLLPWSNLALGIPLLILVVAIVFSIYLIRFPEHKIVRYSLLLLLVQKYSQILNRSHQRILPIRGVKADWDEIPVNISRLWGIPSAGGYGPLILSRMSQLLSMDVLGQVATPEWTLEENRSLDIMAVRFVTIPQDLSQISDLDDEGESLSALKNLNLLDNSRWNLVENIGQATVYENLRPQPRAWLVTEAVKLKPDEVLTTIQSSTLPDGRNYEPSKMALVEENINFKPDQFDSQATVEFKKISETHLQISTNSNAAAFLILSDVYYPGWRAKINGKATKIWQTNYVLRGIKLPQGANTVDFVFKSNKFHFAVGISTAALFVCIYYGVFSWRQINNQL